jgi:hypothetical protein
MRKIFKASMSILFLLGSTNLFYSCKKETVYKEPEAVYDQGDRLILNDNVIVLENSSMTHGGGQPGVFFDKASGVLKFDEACELGVTFDLDTGAVLHLNMEPTAIIRRVTSLETQGGEYILQTKQGFIQDIFDNAAVMFDFNPKFSDLQLRTKSASTLTGDELSKALTDANNRIHPSEVAMMEGDKKVVLFSVKENMPLTRSKSTKDDDKDEDGKVGFTHQVNSQTYLPIPHITFGLEDFGFSLYTKLSAQLSVNKHTRNVNTHIPGVGPVSVIDGVNSVFKVCADSTDINLWADFGIEFNGSVPVVKEDVPLFDPKILVFTFPVGCVPVQIHVQCQLNLGLDFELGGELKMVTGVALESSYPKIELGGTYNATCKGVSIHAKKPHVTVDFNEDFDLIKEFDTPSVKIVQRPLRMEAIAKFTHDFSIRPSLGFSLYETVGPEIGLPVHAVNTMSMGAGESVSMQDTTEAPRVYVGWGSNLVAKAGFTGGVWLDFFGILNAHKDIPEIPLTPEIPIWHTPGSLDLIEKNNMDKTIVGQEKEVEVKVTDSFGLPAPLMFVVWDGMSGGTWKYPVTITGVTGKAKNVYTPASTGKHKPYCYVKNGNLVEAGRITFDTETTAK